MVGGGSGDQTPDEGSMLAILRERVPAALNEQPSPHASSISAAQATSRNRVCRLPPRLQDIFTARCVAGATIADATQAPQAADVDAGFAPANCTEQPGVTAPSMTDLLPLVDYDSDGVIANGLLDGDLHDDGDVSDLLDYMSFGDDTDVADGNPAEGDQPVGAGGAAA